MQFAARALAKVVERNNDRMRRHATDRDEPNPRDLDGIGWNERLERAQPVIRREWDEFVAAGLRLPRIEQVIDEHQGNQGTWRAGLLVSDGRPVGLSERFPDTMAALAEVPNLRSALWSVLDPGTELPEHNGPNAGMLRYHLGIRCGTGSVLQVGDHVVPYRDGAGVLFDDTCAHTAWNRGDQPRTTLFCELMRPAPLPYAALNRAVQRLLSVDSRYRLAPARAVEWDRALNG